MFEGISNLAGMWRQAQEMQGRMQEMTEKLRHERVTGTAGGGMVEAEANGLGELIRVRIDPSLVQRGDREMLEDLIPLAVNQAITKAQEARGQQFQAMAGGMNVPGLQEALAKLIGKG